MRLRTPKRFRSMAGVRRFVANVLTRLDDDQLETDKARVLIYGAKTLAELINDSVLEERIKVLEKKAEQPTQQEAVPH